MSDFYCSTKVKARKEHKCYWCKKTIQKDEQYYRIAGVFQGDFSTRKECEECNTLVYEYCSKYPLDVQLHGIDQEDLNEFRKNVG